MSKRILLSVNSKKKGRNGKPVTLIEGFEGTEEELKQISKKIKTTLGIGGSEKDGIIVIQGDNRDKIMKILQDMGYKTKRVGRIKKQSAVSNWLSAIKMNINKFG